MSSTVSLAMCTAEPAVCNDREPIVPAPRGMSSVSDCTIVMSSIGTPSMSLMIIEKAVMCPWPWALVPTQPVTLPSSPTATLPYSTCSPIGAVTSTYADSPMPSCFTSPLARRAAWSASSDG